MGDQHMNIFHIEGTRLVKCPLCQNIRKIKIEHPMMYTSTMCGHSEQDYIDKIIEQDKTIKLLEETVNELTERHES